MQRKEIIGLSALLGESDLNEEQADYIATLEESGERLLAIVNNILDFTESYFSLPPVNFAMRKPI
ncbi:MAG: histidine kinase dimerization/phospho-acceptor domain-containing protein [Chloroflexota bacterium]